MSNQTSDNNKRIAKNTIFLYMRMIVLMATSLYTSRIVLASLGVKDFGIYNVVGGVVTCLGFLSGTLSTASSRFITVALGKGDMMQMKKIFSNVLLVNLALCIVVLIAGETVGLWFLYEKMLIPQGRMNAAIWVYQLSIVTVLLNIISVPYNAAIIAHEKMKAFAYISLFDAFAKLGVAYLITVSSGIDKLIFYASLLFFIQLVDRIIYGQYCVRNFAETKFEFSYDKALLKEMGTFIGWSAYGSLVSVGFTQGLNILLNLFFGPAVNAARAIAVQVQNAINSFVLNFQTALNPQLTKNVSVENYEQSRFLLIVSSKFSFFLMCIIGVPVIANASFILNIWLKEVPEHSVCFVQIMMIICLFQTLANPLRIINQAEGHIKKFQIYECSYLALIVPLAYVALKFGLDAEYVFVIQLFIEITAQFIRVKIVVPKVEMTVLDYFCEIYLKIIPVFLISLFGAIYVQKLFSLDFIGFFYNCVISEFCILSFIFFIGLSIKERYILTNFIKQKLINK